MSALHQFLARRGLAQGRDVRQAQAVLAAVRGAQHLADGARGAGDEYAFHVLSIVSGLERKPSLAEQLQARIDNRRVVGAAASPLDLL